MVPAPSFPLSFSVWRELAVHEELPEEALPVVVEALCGPAGQPQGAAGRAGRARRRALEEALPALLERVADPLLRARLLAAADRRQLAELAAGEAVHPADLPAVVASGRVTPALVAALARRPDRIGLAVGLLEHLRDTDLESVLWEWNPNRHRPRATPPPEVPGALYDAILERALAPLVTALGRPPVPGAVTHWPGRGADGGWYVLSSAPARWAELASAPRTGRAVQHILLDRATGPGAPPELDTALLLTCLPALCCPELAGLPGPLAALRLHMIADRVRREPRLLALAGPQVRAAAALCVRDGALLDERSGRGASEEAGDRVRLVEDLALTSGEPEHLARCCASLAALSWPVPAGPEGTTVPEGGGLVAGRRGGRGAKGLRRARALAALAANLATPPASVREAVGALHPGEAAWLVRREGAPGWLRTAASARAVRPEDAAPQTSGPLSDEELERLPSPSEVLDAWLDAVRADARTPWSHEEVRQRVLGSRHRTEGQLRRLPARLVLERAPGEAGVPALLAHCGKDPHRWAGLPAALARTGEAELTFGALLAALAQAPEPAKEPAAPPTPTEPHAMAASDAPDTPDAPNAPDAPDAPDAVNERSGRAGRAG